MILNAVPSGCTRALLIDFDECPIYEHSSRLFTNKFNGRGLVTEADLAGFDLVSIANLFNNYIDLTIEEVTSKIEEIVQTVHWKPGAIETLQNLLDRRYFIAIISSGLTDVATAICKAANLNIPVIADELYYFNNTVQGPYTIISDTEKGIVASKIAMHPQFEITATLGHSKGDVALIKSGTKNYRIALNDKPEAIAAADHVINNWDELKCILLN